MMDQWAGQPYSPQGGQHAVMHAGDLQDLERLQQ